MPTPEEIESNKQPESQLLLRFSHNIIEHLGLKLYQNKPTNVLAELVSNSWDADARRVWVDFRNTAEGSPASIAVADDGSGMDEKDLLENYLIVGKPKRSKGNPAQQTPGERFPMGRKGIGKLAPFGVARIVHLLTAKNHRLTWLRFNYDEMLAVGENDEVKLNTYEPKALCRDQDLKGIPLFEALEDAPIVEKFLSNIAEKGNGTLVLSTNLTLRRAINPGTLAESLGRRFTVTLARPDFEVKVDEKPLSEADAFPEWELRLPASGSDQLEVETPLGKKTMNCWAGFVKQATWPAEQAGVGVYAHGKIAQDRPYFFEVKGNEVFSRYLYGVIEADWIDELPKDAISTDRTSINWEDEAFDNLKVVGATKVKAWISAYEKHRKSVVDTENKILVQEATTRHPSLELRETEQTHLLELLNDVTPRLSKDTESKSKFVEAAMKAWVHEPARRLIKQLWTEIPNADPLHFVSTVTKLADQLVPESLSLAVVFAQRIFALDQLQERIAHNRETDLQKLIEEFPWILSNNYDRFIPRVSLRTIVQEAEAADQLPMRRIHTLPASGGNTMPDFAFLSDAEFRHILVVELKGPQATAAWAEHEQLWSYVSYLQSIHGDRKVTGILVARDFAPSLADHRPPSITYLHWSEILVRSRRDHMELLAALLAGSNADPNDARVQQICELGGATVRDFLADMSLRDPELKDIVNRLSLPAVNGANS